METIEWNKIAIIIIVFSLGVAIGHVQEAHWAEYRENALKVQIERQDCSDVNPFKPLQGKETSP